MNFGQTLKNLILIVSLLKILKIDILILIFLLVLVKEHGTLKIYIHYYFMLYNNLIQSWKWIGSTHSKSGTRDAFAKV